MNESIEVLGLQRLIVQQGKILEAQQELIKMLADMISLAIEAYRQAGEKLLEPK